ncbi:MAG: phosphatase PAP2 family protein [Candidatus Marinimicrobia bacterium]|nr:phosphatase PAP2 family protein [Candidatus Neomarinimicrobiota bacterium]MCF7850663.1 phosphatase PAP2 family protein [Candidatus Neomarinimicrobiota bacterium]MCF7904466.1 phosphatase PAP2 family protein [Candidatus Neomarinimicrobiota bacterium]
MKKRWIYLLLSLFVLNTYAQVKPDVNDFTVAALGMGAAVGLELFAKDHLMPSEPRFSVPNSFDQKMRTRAFWGQHSMHKAIDWSDRLLYGVSFTSIAWGPLLAESRESAFLINAEVFAANAVATNLAKIIVARERPYHFYATSNSQGSDDYASFFSGHTSVAFSQAVTNAMILSESYAAVRPYIWASLLGTAGLTGYFRIAGDMHYATDVITGAVVGSLIAWSITRYELDRFSKGSGTDPTVMLTMKIPLGRMISM